MNSSSETTTSPLRVLIVTGAISSLNFPAFCARRGLGLRAEGELVLLVAGDLELRRDVLGGHAHVIAVEGVEQPVAQERVDELDAAHLGSVAQIGRVLGGAHALHAAGGYDLAFAGLDLLGRKRHRAQARATELVDAEGGLRVGKAGRATSLAGGVLPFAGGEDLTEDQLVDVGDRNAGAFEGALDRDGGEVVRPKRSQCAVETADGRARRGYDDDIGHDAFLSLSLD